MENIEELISLAQSGDADAEAQVLKNYAKLVKSMASSYYYVTSADIDLEDLVQEGMIALMRALRTYSSEAEASFETYATRCVRNAIIDELRKTPEPSIPIDEDMEAPAAQPPLSELAEALSSILTPDERAVLELRLEARSYKEIAEKLGIQKKKVDNLIVAAKKKLKNFLK